MAEEELTPDQHIDKHYCYNPSTKSWEIKEPLVEGGLTGPIKFSNTVDTKSNSPTPVKKTTKKKTRRKKRSIKKKPI